MARKLRVQYPGAMYRGDHLEVIFRAIAQTLRAEPTVTHKCIAQYLSIGAPGYLLNCLRTAKA